jgi:hypothetical protein
VGGRYGEGSCGVENVDIEKGEGEGKGEELKGRRHSANYSFLAHTKEVIIGTRLSSLNKKMSASPMLASMITRKEVRRYTGRMHVVDRKLIG